MSANRPLTERQEACLELVAKGLTSKEIAQRTGLAPRSVDTYLAAAMATLGAGNRREAARIYLSTRVSQELRSQSDHVANDPAVEDVARRTGPAWLIHMLFPIPLGGGTNSLSASEKLLYGARIGLAGMVSLLAIATTFVGLMAAL